MGPAERCQGPNTWAKTLVSLVVALVTGCSDRDSTGISITARQATEQSELARVSRGRMCGSFEGLTLCGADEHSITPRPLLSDPVRIAPDSGGVFVCTGDPIQCRARIVVSGGVLANGSRIVPGSTVRLAVAPTDPSQGRFAGPEIIYSPDGFKALAEVEITLVRSEQLPLDSGTPLRIAVLIASRMTALTHAALLRDFGAEIAIVASPVTLTVRPEPAPQEPPITPTVPPLPAASPSPLRATPPRTANAAVTRTTRPTPTATPAPLVHPSSNFCAGGDHRPASGCFRGRAGAR